MRRDPELLIDRDWRRFRIKTGLLVGLPTFVLACLPCLYIARKVSHRLDADIVICALVAVVPAAMFAGFCAVIAVRFYERKLLGLGEGFGGKRR